MIISSYFSIWLILNKTTNGKYMNIIKSYFSKFKKKSKSKVKKSLKKAAKRYSKDAMELDIPIASYYYILYKLASKLNYHYRASDMMLRVIKLQPKAKHYFTLSKPLIKSNQWWRVVDALSKAIELHKEAPVMWRSEYASALGKMNRFKDAAKEWEEILKLDSNNAQWYFKFGVNLKEMDKHDQAEDAFDKAIILDKKNDSKSLGIGIFYEKEELWTHANKAYMEELLKQPNNALLYFKTGLSFDRIYNWEDAEKYFIKALDLDPLQGKWQYRLGFVLERQKKWDEAAKSYKKAIADSHIFNEYWVYRLGFVSNKEKDYKESCDTFLKMNTFQLSLTDEFDDVKEKIIAFIVNEKSDSDEYEININNIVSWSELVQFIKYIIERKEDFLPELYYSLGFVLAQTKKYSEASHTFIEQCIIQEAHGINVDLYQTDDNVRKRVNYTEYYEYYRLDEKSILYESYHGTSISCNPYAIFKAILMDEKFKNFKHIWVIDDKDKIPNALRKNPNVIFIKKNCDLYMRYLAKAKYLINNVTFPAYFIRKTGQIYLNTWHGTPIKTLGRDVKKDFMAHKNQTKNFLQTSHVISPNLHTSSTLMNSYDISESFTGILATTGYPRQDLMLNISNDEKRNIYQELNISSEQNIVLYAPTWRGNVKNAVFNRAQLKNDIQKLQEIENIHILFRGHYMIEDGLSRLNTNITIVPSTIDTNSLLSIVDILITDYSSIAIDYIALGKPIIYYAYDRAEYAKERGLYFALEELGGEVCCSLRELKASLKKFVKNSTIAETQKNAQQIFCPYDDGKATDRVIDLIFFDKKEEVDIAKNSTKESILIYGGPLMANGITTSFINLANHIDKNKYSLTIVIDTNAITSDELRMEQFNKFDSDIKIIPSNGHMLMTIEEQWIISKFERERNLNNNELWKLYEISYKREFKRVFGYGKFNHIINFEGYTVFWTALMGMHNDTARSNTIYQHNDLYGEWIMKYPYLELTFNLYHFYNHFVSVSKETKEHNKNNLSGRFNLKREKFIYCDNIQNLEVIIDNAKRKLEVPDDEKLFKGTKVFINIGRLSPEKGQKKLIKAFKKVSEKYPEARLINLGFGPLKEEIDHLIKELQLENKVLFLGQRSNPYAYLQKADCFVLSSDHEGQPMTLFEAMILRKPIIATNIVGNRSVLEGRPGLLVENSEEGLGKGMLEFISGLYVDVKVFDSERYNQDALNMFYTKVLRG